MGKSVKQAWERDCDGVTTMPRAATSTLLESLRKAFLSHGRQPEVYVLAFSTLLCPTKEFNALILAFTGIIRVEEENFDFRLTFWLKKH